MNFQTLQRRLFQTAQKYSGGAYHARPDCDASGAVGRLAYVLLSRGIQRVGFFILITALVIKFPMEGMNTILAALIDSLIIIFVTIKAPIYTPKKPFYEALVSISTMSIKSPEMFVTEVGEHDDYSCSKAIRSLAIAVYRDSPEDV